MMIARRDVLKGGLAIGAAALAGMVTAPAAASGPVWQAFSYPSSNYRAPHNRIKYRQIVAVPGESSAEDALERLLRDDPVWSQPGVKYEGAIYRELPRPEYGSFVGWRDIDGPPSMS